MRVMEIPPFPQKIEISGLDSFIRTRLSRTLVMWPEQAIPLLGYMCHPNDGEARDEFLLTLRSWPEASKAAPPTVPRKLGRIQNDWLRVADILHLLCDLAEGRHQARRRGPSVGKAITLLQASAKSWGTKTSTLWKNWSTYKDVAHLIAAATLICAEARAKSRIQWFGRFGLSVNQLIPFQMAMLMPDLVLAVALEFERLGLGLVPHARTDPTLDPDTLWRIPPDINVAPLPPPIRKIRPQDLKVLSNRRAGKRGRAKARKSASVPG
jgi:hypothetical protein